MKKLRIILNSNAPWATSGYSVQVEQFAFRIKKEGYEIALVNFFGQEGGKFALNNVLMFPRMFSVWGEDATLEHGKRYNADVTMTLQDVWTLNPAIVKQFKRFIPILPIDHLPPPPAVIERARLAYRIVSYSKFGETELRKLGLHSTYIPHTVETTILKPMENKAELRKKYAMPPDAFIFGMVSANKDNPSRKSFQEVIDAFKDFHVKHPDAVMYFHSLIDQQGGFPIRQYWDFLGLPPNKIFFLQPYDILFSVGRKELAEIYNCMDCVLCPSSNEGFGVPIVEAQSCGIPVITNNFTAMPELIIPGKTGFLTEVAYKQYDALGGYIGRPSIGSIHNAMVDIWKADRKKMGEEGRNFILENYDADRVFKEKWFPFLEQLEREIYIDNTPPTQ